MGTKGGHLRLFKGIGPIAPARSPKAEAGFRVAAVGTARGQQELRGKRATKANGVSLPATKAVSVTYQSQAWRGQLSALTSVLPPQTLRKPQTRERDPGTPALGSLAPRSPSGRG